MALPQELGDIARELARRGTLSGAGPAYRAGVCDALGVVGELMQVGARSLRTTLPHDAISLRDRLLRLSADLGELLDRPEALHSLGAREQLYVRQSRELIEYVLQALLERSPEGPPTRHRQPRVSNPASSRGTWLAAYVLSELPLHDEDDEVVNEILRLAAFDPDVIDAAIRRLQLTDVPADRRTRSMALVTRARRSLESAPVDGR